MDAGDFNTRVEIKRLAKTSDGYGGTTSTLSIYDTVWAKKTDKSGDISSNNGRRKINDEIELVIRKKSADQIENDDLIKIEGEAGEFRITSLFDSQHRYYTAITAVKLV